MGRASGPNHINRDSSQGGTSVATDNTGGRRSSFKTSAKELFQGKDEDDPRGTYNQMMSNDPNINP